MGRVVEVVVLGIVALLAILLVVRPLVTSVFRSGAAARREGQGALPRPSDSLEAPPPLPAAQAAILMEDSVDEGVLIDISRIEGKVKDSSVRKIANVVDKHPEEAAAIIRSWMHENR
ncbi:MAG: hypothetical protein HY521_10735 [Proteobacteria bacterium]|nr:hypothetical protein [Pseudomonadota bacterium]